MTRWLFRLFVKNPENVSDRKVRAAYGTLGSVTGIIVNILLSAMKFIVGTVSGSLAVTADAVNNLSDSAGSLMSLVTVRLAVKPNDRTHPFGHARMEYLGALAVGVIILIAGFQLLMEGVKSIIHPAQMQISLVMLLLLVVSMLTKLWLFFYYRKIARLIDNQTLYAASRDSLSDIFATGAVATSMLLQWVFHWTLDGYIGVVVALFVLKGGFDVCKDTVDRLLGGKPDSHLIEDIRSALTKYDAIRGLHDLIIHDYGPGRCIASVHAEVSATGDIVAIHDVIDQAERDLKQTLGIEVVIHMDPTVTDDPTTNALREQITSYLRGLDARLTLHDFRVVPGERQTNLIFDCLMPDGAMDKAKLLSQLRTFVKQIDPRYELVVQFDTDYS